MGRSAPDVEEAELLQSPELDPVIALLTRYAEATDVGPADDLVDRIDVRVAAEAGTNAAARSAGRGRASESPVMRPAAGSIRVTVRRVPTDGMRMRTLGIVAVGVIVISGGAAAGVVGLRLVSPVTNVEAPDEPASPVRKHGTDAAPSVERVVPPPGIRDDPPPIDAAPRPDDPLPPTDPDAVAAAEEVDRVAPPHGSNEETGSTRNGPKDDKPEGPEGGNGRNGPKEGKPNEPKDGKGPKGPKDDKDKPDGPKDDKDKADGPKDDNDKPDGPKDDKDKADGPKDENGQGDETD